MQQAVMVSHVLKLSKLMLKKLLACTHSPIPHVKGLMDGRQQKSRAGKQGPESHHGHVQHHPRWAGSQEHVWQQHRCEEPHRKGIKLCDFTHQPVADPVHDSSVIAFQLLAVALQSPFISLSTCHVLQRTSKNHCSGVLASISSLHLCFACFPSLVHSIHQFSRLVSAFAFMGGTL